MTPPSILIFMYFSFISLLSLKIGGINTYLSGQMSIHIHIHNCILKLIDLNEFHTALFYHIVNAVPTASHLCYYPYTHTDIKLLCCCCCLVANISTSINFCQMTIEFCNCGCQKCDGLSLTLSSAVEFSQLVGHLVRAPLGKWDVSVIIKR